MPHLGIFGAVVALFVSQMITAIAFGALVFRRRPVAATVQGQSSDARTGGL
jgi:hypothetical protein